MKFKEVVDGVYYYDVYVSIKNKKSHVVLPRYHIFLGWIEIFGFPPQHEWVVLSDIKSFSKKAIISIDGEDISEQIDFNLNKKEGFHEIVTTRELGNTVEVFRWFEDYTKAPTLIKSNGEFESGGKKYKYTEEKSPVSRESLVGLNIKQKKFVKDIEDKYGKSDAIWKKSFKSKGVLPSLFYKMFPIDEVIDLSNTTGSIVEVGYLEKEGDDIDLAHGDWYKLIEVNGEYFYIEEGDYSPTTIKIDGKKKHIKGTYATKLYYY